LLDLAWGAGLPLLPLIIGSGNELLSGPLKNINALNYCITDELFQFISDLGRKLELTPEDPSVYSDKIDDLARMCIQIRSFT
jgi:hypothetical protein